MASTVLLKRGSGVPPGNKLTSGELAIDMSAGEVYTKKTDGTVVKVGGGGGMNLGYFMPPGVISNPSVSNWTRKDPDSQYNAPYWQGKGTFAVPAGKILVINRLENCVNVVIDGGAFQGNSGTNSTIWISAIDKDNPGKGQLCYQSCSMGSYSNIGDAYILGWLIDA
jgi:hypothetical protein